MVMPRNVMVVAGPSSLSKATGIPSLSHTLSMVTVISLQVGCPGEPARRKSSRSILAIMHPLPWQLHHLPLHSGWGSLPYRWHSLQWRSVSVVRPGT